MPPPRRRDARWPRGGRRWPSRAPGTEPPSPSHRPHEHRPKGSIRSIMEPVRSILFDYGHTLVDFHRTQEALHAAYEQIRARIEAVAYMEVPEILDLIERVAGGIDHLVGQSYADNRMEEIDLPATFRETLATVGFDLPEDVVRHIVELDHSAYSNSI